MKMKKILTEWRRFTLNESIEKSNFEKIIEDAWAKSGQPYNEDLAYVKAALHASTYMNGSGTTNEEEYLNRVEFGKTATERIQELNRDSALFAKYFDADEVYHPAEDKRFKDTRENRFKGIGITQSWARHNMNPSRITGVFAKGNDEAEAYTNLFSKFEQLDQMLSSGDYNFLSAFGRQAGKTNMDIRHSGGAASTGLLITPSEATDAEQEKMMKDYLFYMQNSANPDVNVAIEAESKLQSAINIALSLWKKYGGFKDSGDEQVNKGAYLRMKKALSRSEATIKKLLRSPDLYEPETPTEEPKDEYEVAMATKDKSEANRIMRSLQKAGDKRWRDIRTRMRSM